MKFVLFLDGQSGTYEIHVIQGACLVGEPTAYVIRHDGKRIYVQPGTHVDFVEFQWEVYPVGTRYKTRGKNPKTCTVIDILRTYNSKDELVSVRYVSEHEFMGQTLSERNVIGTTIKMGLISE